MELRDMKNKTATAGMLRHQGKHKVKEQVRKHNAERRDC